MSIKRAAIDAARVATGRGIVEGNFDGFTGAAFTGWVRAGRGEVVALMYGDEVVTHARCLIPRPDLAGAGLAGSGFAVDGATVQSFLREQIERGSIHARPLRAVATSGSPLTGGTAEITPEDLLGVMAVAMSIQMLGARFEETPLDLQ